MSEVYLGDGAYAKCDGFHIIVYTSDGRNVTNQVFLEDRVFAEFLKFAFQIWPHLDPYKAGYIQALRDYSIWKDGEQRIGCLNTPIKEIIAKKFPES